VFNSLLISLFLLFLFPQSIFAKVTINEFSSGTNNDWVELYNTPDATESANLAEYVLKDSLDSNIGGELSGNLPAAQWQVIDVGSRLNKDGDTVRLFKNNDLNTSIDSISYGVEGSICAASETESIGRLPDGSGNFVRFSAQTKQLANSSSQSICPTPTPTSTPTNAPTSAPEATTAPTTAPTATPKPTVKPASPQGGPTATPKKSPSPSSSASPEATSQVLSAATTSPSASPTPKPKENTVFNKNSLIQIIFIGLGSIFVIASAVSFLRTRFKNPEDPTLN
jgi:hypothetical protein